MKSWFEPRDFLAAVQAEDVSGSVQGFKGVAEKLTREEPLPAELRSRLQELSLLYGIPFAYLAPRHDLLPPESIRFFHLDGNWIFSLLDGALSLGRALAMDVDLDRAIIGGVYREAISGNHAIRLAKQGHEVTGSESNEADGSTACTGFLLRSIAVSGWRGMEFKAYDGEREVTALRIETLGPEVLLALYRGTISRVAISQPPEGLHFGLGRSKDGNGFEKKLRALHSGELLPKDAFDCTPYLNTEDVINFENLAGHMETQLAEQLKQQGLEQGKKGGGGEQMNAAVFALQMIQNAYTVVYEKQIPDSSKK